MTCPCKDMKILWHQQFLHDFDRSLFLVGAGQHSPAVDSESSAEPNPGCVGLSRPFPLAPAAAPVGAGAALPPPFPMEITVSGSKINLAAPWCFFP